MHSNEFSFDKRLGHPEHHFNESRSETRGPEKREVHNPGHTFFRKPASAPSTTERKVNTNATVGTAIY